MKKAKTILISAFLLIFIVLTIKDMSKIKDLTGKTFGRLSVISFYAVINHDARWNCVCECGNKRIISGHSLRRGCSNSCGCLHNEIIKKVNTTHGLHKSREYKTWNAIKNRCLNPGIEGYKHYGGRGISICDEWKDSFQKFYSYVGPRPTPKHSLDRINNNGNYEPGNVRWATQKEQCNNTSRNYIVTFNGVTSTLSQMCEMLNLNIYTIGSRIFTLGWSPEKSFTTKIAHKKKKVT